MPAIAAAGAAATFDATGYFSADPPPEGWHSYEATRADHAPIADAERRDSDLAGIFYTGGSTGRAKGVMLSHDNLSATR